MASRASLDTAPGGTYPRWRESGIRRLEMGRRCPGYRSLIRLQQTVGRCSADTESHLQAAAMTPAYRSPVRLGLDYKGQTKRCPTTSLEKTGRPQKSAVPHLPMTPEEGMLTDQPMQGRCLRWLAHFGFHPWTGNQVHPIQARWLEMIPIHHLRTQHPRKSHPRTSTAIASNPRRRQSRV